MHGRPDGSGAARAWTEELFTRHGRMVTGLCRLLVRDPAEAEDAAQQTFLSAHRALLNGSTPREPAPWLAAIARNECRARARARMREPLLLGETESPATASDALSEAIRRADLVALWRAIVALPVQQREALLLREFGGLSYEELAAALSVSESAVESLLFRARRGLRERLSEVYAGVGGTGVGGTGWLDAVGRLFAGGSGAAAPVAAKAVAVGVAVMAGGAVVAPDMLQHRPPARPVPAKTHPAPRSTVQAVGDFVPAAQAPGELHAAVPSTRPAAQPVVLAVPSQTDGRSSSDGPAAARSGDDGTADRAGGGGGGDPAATDDLGNASGSSGSPDAAAPAVSTSGDDASGDGSAASVGSDDGGGAAGTQADGGGRGDGAVGGDGGHDGQSAHGGDAGDG